MPISINMTDSDKPVGFGDTSKFLTELKTKPENVWIEKGQQRALNLFHQMAVRVPAYKDFLKKNKVHPEKIKSFADFQQLPTIDKNSYLREYPRESTCWDGKFASKQWVISATSGSTGEPFYFPRQSFQDWQYATTADMYLQTNFDIQNKSTLYIIGFPMGVWIGGLFTYQAIKYLQENRKYKLSIISPGINKLEIIKAVKNLGSNFDQVIIGSYAPFLKDILDDGIDQGIEWNKYNMGFIFSAEVFSETFRDYVNQRTQLSNIFTRTLNHYGTVDLGTMSHETPLSIFMRRVAVTNQKIYKSLFGQITKLPTLTQFVPEHFYFEEINGNLLCSSFSGLPLVRYDLKDHGGVFTLQDAKQKFLDYGIDFDKASTDNGFGNTLWNLPFVYVYERSDFSVSFFAFQIYPETIRKALQHKSLEKFITGKFTMLVRYDEIGNQVFEINIEKKPNVKENYNLVANITKLIMDKLTQENSEYRKTRDDYPDRVKPNLVFWPYENETHFKPGTKQKWVKK